MAPDKNYGGRETPAAKFILVVYYERKQEWAAGRTAIEKYKINVSYNDCKTVLDFRFLDFIHRNRVIRVLIRVTHAPVINPLGI